MLAEAEKVNTARDIIKQLNVVHDIHRVFETSEKDAQLYGISEALFDDLIPLGLRYQSRPEGRFFDSDDLYNISLYLDLPSVHKMAMRSWAKAFRTAGRSQRLTLSYGLQDAADKPESCQILSWEDGYIDISPTDPTVVFQYTVEINPAGVGLPQDVCELLHRLTTNFSFYMLHDAIRWDLPFMETHRIGECGGFSKLIVREARAAGYTARQVFGILASPPFGTGHYWAEIQIEDVWIKLDPLMIQLLITQGRLDGATNPICSSPSGALIPLAVVADHDDIGAPILAGQPKQKFIKEPIILSARGGLPVSISVVQEV